MGDDVVTFAVFTLICSAFLAGLMLHYNRRVNRLRNLVTRMSAVNDLVPQPVPVRSDKR
jgi:Na+-translocating ferredoxin:NAD+ oxidoreductase RnfG subunit